jgi:hypothetical protein
MLCFPSVIWKEWAKAGGSFNPFPPPRCANMHDIEAYIDIDSIVDYAVAKL